MSPLVLTRNKATSGKFDNLLAITFSRLSLSLEAVAFPVSPPRYGICRPMPVEKGLALLMELEVGYMGEVLVAADKRQVVA